MGSAHLAGQCLAAVSAAAPVEVVDSSWDAALEGRFAHVLAEVPPSCLAPSRLIGDDMRPGAPPRTPVWIRLTLALHETWSGASASPEDPALLDLVWGQYSLFLWVRLQDDLLDRHFRDLRLQFVANRFLLEGLAALERVPGLGPAFRAACRARLLETTGAILDVERLQSLLGEFTAAHLPLHAQVAALFTVGPEAVCHRLKHRADLPWVRELQAQIAISSQIVDDLEDLLPDLDQGRYTFVANVLAGPLGGGPVDAAVMSRRVTDGIMVPSRCCPIWHVLAAAAAIAEAALPDHAPPLTRELATDLTRMPAMLAEQLHRARVRALFGAQLEARAEIAAMSGG